MPEINYNIDAYNTMFPTYRVKVKEKNVFQRCQFRNFDGGTVTENQGHENSEIVRALFIQTTLQATQTIIYLTWCNDGF